MTQFQLARKSRINPATVSLIENEHLEPTPDQRDRLAKALNVDVTDVFPPKSKSRVPGDAGRGRVMTRVATPSRGCSNPTCSICRGARSSR
jgi:transcriptional regulator with XRE-family HTH domain